MSDKKPPSITEAILANPKSFLTPEQQREGQPSPQIGDTVDAAKDVATAAKAWIQDQPVHVGDDRSGELAPPHSPTARVAGGGPPGGWLRARHPADSPPPSITKAILDNPHRFQPPEPSPEPGHDHDAGREQ